ncbi:tail fiber assembly protein [Citrobacter europaeus]|uniref:tail fiber assembly protein n=1 Tax=Citrobacter europaeus TaxID=1914243 RepID=UPI001BCADFE0|nr:tail fiber assembly protein [Citrobacter europaeus]
MNYIYSAETNSFYPLSLKSEYEASGTWPSSYIEVSDDTFYEFTQNKEGKVRAPDADGRPVWVDIPSPPNDVLLSLEISKLGVLYKQDIADLNTAYLAAIVSDGPSEVTKQQIVRDQITQRKAQYVADIAAAKEKYPI